jgi:hypothetical protein
MSHRGSFVALEAAGLSRGSIETSREARGLHETLGLAVGLRGGTPW